MRKDFRCCNDSLLSFGQKMSFSNYCINTSVSDIRKTKEVKLDFNNLVLVLRIIPTMTKMSSAARSMRITSEMKRNTVNPRRPSTTKSNTKETAIPCTHIVLNTIRSNFLSRLLFVCK